MIHMRIIMKKIGLIQTMHVELNVLLLYIMTKDNKYIKKELADKLRETGTIHSNDSDCFWTDCFFAKPEEMEEFMTKNNLETIDHLAVDGLSPCISDKVDAMTENEVNIWCDYHYSVCREKSLLGASNHGLVVGRK